MKIGKRILSFLLLCGILLFMLPIAAKAPKSILKGEGLPPCGSPQNTFAPVVETRFSTKKAT